MSLNYSTPMNYNLQGYEVQQKSPQKQAIKGAAIGAIALGGASLGVQKYLLSESSNKLFENVAEKVGEEIVAGKKGFWSKTLGKMLKIRFNGKLDWAKAGKAALIGGAIVGGISALVASRKNKKAEAQAQMPKYPYYA